EALNESPLGYVWPTPKQRVEMLEEAIVIIKKLWSGKFITFRGKYYRLKKAKLYTTPVRPIKIYVAAGGPKVAELAGRHADGILTGPGGLKIFRELFHAFEEGAKKVGRKPELLEKVVELLVSYDEDYEKALKSCRFWRGSMLPLFFKYDISDPREIEEHGKLVGDEALAERWIIATTADEHIEVIEKYVKAGFNHIYFVSSSPDEKKFIKFYGEKVLPYFRQYSK
ncbi:MAG: LLM class flavin-dependent oxidoreductase, partial [Candidatus Bathyarchaeia archaeon]